MVCDNYLEIVRLLGRNIYSERLKNAFPKISIADVFSPYDGNHLAIMDLKSDYGLILYFDCTRHVPPIYFGKIDTGIVLSAVQFLKPIEKGETPDSNI